MATIRIQQLLAQPAPVDRPTASTATLPELELYGVGIASPLTIFRITQQEPVRSAMWESPTASPVRKAVPIQTTSLVRSALPPMWPIMPEQPVSFARQISPIATIATKCLQVEP